MTPSKIGILYGERNIRQALDENMFVLYDENNKYESLDCGDGSFVIHNRQADSFFFENAENRHEALWDVTRRTADTFYVYTICASGGVTQKTSDGKILAWYSKIAAEEERKGLLDFVKSTGHGDWSSQVWVQKVDRFTLIGNEYMVGSDAKVFRKL